MVHVLDIGLRSLIGQSVEPQLSAAENTVAGVTSQEISKNDGSRGTTHGTHCTKACAQRSKMRSSSFRAEEKKERAAKRSNSEESDQRQVGLILWMLLTLIFGEPWLKRLTISAFVPACYSKLDGRFFSLSKGLFRRFYIAVP